MSFLVSFPVAFPFALPAPINNYWGQLSSTPDIDLIVKILTVH